MCRTRVRSVVDVATLCVVLIAVAAAAAAAATSVFSDDFYSSPKIVIIGPNRATQHFWSENMVEGKRPKFNDPSFGVVPTSRGYRRVYGGPWMLFKHPPRKVAGLTKQLPSQTPYTRFNAGDDTMSQNFGGYARRSVSEMSQAEEEYQAVRRALARDRARPMRRSMTPTTGTTPNTGGKPKDKTVEDLLPLMTKLAGLIDKLDSFDGDVKNGGEDEMGKTKQSAVLLLKSLITGLQQDVEKSSKKLHVQSRKAKGKSREYTRRGNVDGFEESSNPDNGSSIVVDHSKNGTKNDSSSLMEPLDKVGETTQQSKESQNRSKRVFKRVNPQPSSTMTVPTTENLNSTDTSVKVEFRTGLDAAFRSSTDTSSGLIPEHRAFDSARVEGQGLTEDADTPVELVNRAFDNVTPLRRKNIARRTENV